MLRVGLTGGIGSGKSEVARLLAAHGAFVIDADQVAREVLEPGTPGFARVVEAFGRDVVSADGSLDRAALAARVFPDPERLGVLNAIVHPLIAARTGDLMAGLAADTILINDVPLLVENGLSGAYDLVVVVDAPEDVRLQRLLGRGLTPDDARARMSTQSSREERLAVADYVIDNSGAPERLGPQVDQLWNQLVAAEH